MELKHFVVGASSFLLAYPAFALKGYDDAHQCEVELKGNYKLEGLNIALKEGTKATFYDGCEKKIVTLEIREVNRWEKLEGIGYTIGTLDRSRMDDLRARRFDMKDK